MFDNILHPAVHLTSSSVASRHHAEGISDTSLNMTTVNSTLFQSKLGFSSAIKERVGAVTRAVRFVGGYHGDVHVLELGEFIAAAVGLAMAHAGESHTDGEGVPHVVALQKCKTVEILGNFQIKTRI
jgi:hypothetical protein